MKFEYFVAKRLFTAKDYKSSISSPIINIAISAIAIGIIMMMIAVATGIGLQQKIREKIASFNGHIIISNFDNNQSETTIAPVNLKQSFYPKFTTIPAIEHIQAIATKAGIIRTETAFEGILFKGVGNDYNWKYIQEYIIQGRLPIVSQSLNQEVIISEVMASRLRLKLGNSFHTYFIKPNGYNVRSFTIVGIFNSGFQEFDTSYILGDIRHIQRLNKWSKDQVGAFEIFVSNFNNIEAVGQEVYQETSSSLDSKTIVEKYSYIFDWLQLFDINIIVILVVMILVATINMIVALLVLILERTQMIGILKALGASNGSIRKIFLYNAVYLIAKGLFWGNLIGISILLLQHYFGIVKLNPENYYVNQAPIYFNIGYIVLLNLITFVVCFLALLLPSYITTRISPIRALRYQ